MAERLAGGCGGLTLRRPLNSIMAKSHYKGGKQRRHFTLSDQAHAHLAAIAGQARLSKSEALERIIRAFSFHDAFILTDAVWPDIIDNSSSLL